MTKQCSKCRETKPVEGFGQDRSRKDGLCYSCKECKNAANTTWRTANLDKARTIEAAWRAANRDRAKAASVAWRAANPDRQKARLAAYRAGGRSPDMPWPEGPIGYSAAHRRVEAIYGLAKNHDCLHCGGSAAEWAYDYGDLDEFSGPRLDSRDRSGSVRVMRWSGKPQHYMPLCKSCHITHDQKKESAA